MIPISLDIKEMYTNLPHEKIVEAVEYVLFNMSKSKRSRTEYVRVPKDPEETVSFGKSLNLEEYKHISFA